MLEEYWTDLCDLKDPLLSSRKKGWDRFSSIGLPKPKQEAFQYISKNWSFPELAKKPEVRKDQKGQEAIVFIDGFFQEKLSSFPSPVICLPMEQAIRTYGLFLQPRMRRTIEEETDPFAALNGAFQGGGVFIYVPPKCKAALQLCHTMTSDRWVSPRVHIYVGQGSTLKLEQTGGQSGGFSNGLIDLVLDAAAHVQLNDFMSGDFQALRASLKRDATLKTVHLGKMKRHSLQVELKEQNSEVMLYGLSDLMGQEEAHFHVLVEHKAEHARSTQHFKSVVKEEGKFSFEGKIYVHPEAQKTEAYQLNNNLLFSDLAKAHSKPNLEIFADDVKASHGATFGRLDEEEIFYLRSRGLTKSQAEAFLVDGFCQEISRHAK